LLDLKILNALIIAAFDSAKIYCIINLYKLFRRKYLLFLRICIYMAWNLV